MGRIRNGAQVTISYTLATRDVLGEESLCPSSVLSFAVGAGQVISALEEAVIGMCVLDVKDIVVDREEFAELPDEVGTTSSEQAVDGKVTLRLEIVKFLNVPDTKEELLEFLHSRRVPIQRLCDVSTYSKGKFLIQKTYDAASARDIGEEYNILAALRKSASSNNKFENLIGDVFNDKFHIFQTHLYTHQRCPDSDHTTNEDWNSICNSFPDRCINNNHYANLSLEDVSACYYLPLIYHSQSPRSFLPTILTQAASLMVKLIVIFDHASDWDVFKSHQTNSYTESQYAGHGNDYLTIGDVSLDVYIESEASESTGNTVLTWLRTNDLRTNYDAKVRSAPESGRRSGIQLEGSEMSYKSMSELMQEYNNSRDSIPYDTTSSKSSSPTSSENKLVYNDHDMPGYRVGILRFAGWSRGEGECGNGSSSGGMPELRVWNGFWLLYKR
jgi:FKBP-type peptidyl-prolyl cis-trans isomerase